MSDNKKGGIDFSRNSVWSVLPTEVCIVGGKDLLSGDEVGPLDTATNEDFAKHLRDDLNLQGTKLTEEEILNTNTLGVIVGITVERLLHPTLGPILACVDGRTRLRRLRVVNVRRAAAGLPLMKLEASQKRGDATHILSMKISTNLVRRKDESIQVKISALKDLLQLNGNDLDDAAIRFGCHVATIKGYLAYEDNATPEVKRAVDAGLSTSAGAQLAKIKDPTKQNEKLADLLASPNKPTARAARVAAGAKATPSKTELRAFEMAIGKPDAPVTAEFAQAADVLLAWILRGELELDLLCVSGCRVHGHQRAWKVSLYLPICTSSPSRRVACSTRWRLT